MRTDFPKIFTPLGSVDCYIESQHKLDLPQMSWTNRDVKKTALPEGMKVDGLSAFLLTLTGSCSALKIYVSTVGIKEHDKNPESGQFLDTIGIYSENYALSIGIWDGEFFNSKVPVRIQKQEGNEFEWIKYNKGNFIVEIPALQNRETLVLPIAVAWRKNPPADDCSTWFAVDRALPW